MSDAGAERPVRVCWIADDEDEASYVAAARLPDVVPLAIEWHRTVPDLTRLVGYDLLVADPGALRIKPDELEQHVHAELPSLPIVFYSGLRQDFHVRGGSRLHWTIPALVEWISHGEASLTTELPRRLARFARPETSAS